MTKKQAESINDLFYKDIQKRLKNNKKVTVAITAEGVRYRSDSFFQIELMRQIRDRNEMVFYKLKKIRELKEKRWAMAMYNWAKKLDLVE